MNLRRQLLLVSLLTLVLPWSGWQFIRETESALREGQQNMLSGTARAIADSLSQFPAEFLESGTDGTLRDKQIYAHPLEVEPLIDGYREDWTLETASLRSMRGADGDIRYVVGSYRQHLFLFVDVRDANIVYATPTDTANADRVELVSIDAEGQREKLEFYTEAPGEMLGRRRDAEGESEDSRLQAHWQETSTGYQLEARIPWRLLGEYLGIVVSNADPSRRRSVESTSFDGTAPGRLITVSPVLASVISGYAQPDLRLIVTDRAGWRLAQAGRITSTSRGSRSDSAGWLRIAYSALLEPGQEAAFAEPGPLGRERQSYVQSALDGDVDGAWFRSAETGRAVVAVAQPVWSGSVQTGVVILQQGTDAILSLRNAALGRLMTFTLIATLGVALILLAYASWLSLRIRRLSAAAEDAVDNDATRLALPSALSADEIGDLSRSFSNVLRQLGDYNEYLRSLASKLSHELRTPLTIVSSSLDNLEHEPLSDDAAQYTARARDGVARLRKILDAMSEANRVEELMQNAEPETFDLGAVLASATDAYTGAWPERRFRFDLGVDDAFLHGSPELIVQMLDKLVDNAVSFSGDGDEILISLTRNADSLELSVFNPGPPLPDKMRHQLFDSMVSMRSPGNDKHLGLGLYIARLIAQGHGGTIAADNVDAGVVFVIRLPGQAA